ncbi:uncharacterized protein LOC110840249 isoform X3 [Zootermopsis nevadensis]|uniref:uncharacterized protein LOC110840249 isoform X3 n=1 Tax=Zootermopsis nevadensis TaxID=136037 RepID=UPI000B8EA712|nr:uncharacterized protein LOC110840249 isoform X3 [Zootermopsis nevadensis]
MDFPEDSKPDRKIPDKSGKRRRQKQESSAFGHGSDRPDLESSSEGRNVATVETTQDREIFGKIRRRRQQKQESSAFGNGNDRPDLESSSERRPIAAVENTPDREMFGKIRRRTQQKQESSAFGNGNDRPDLESSSEGRNVATVETTQDREIFGKIRRRRQQKQESSAFGNGNDRPDLESSSERRPVAAVETTQDREMFGKSGQHSQHLQGSCATEHQADPPEVTPPVREHTVATAESNPVQVFEEPVRPRVQEQQPPHGLPFAHTSTRNAEYQYSYQHLNQYLQCGGVMYPWPSMYPPGGGIYAHPLQGDQSVFQYQNYPYPLTNFFPFPVANPYYGSAPHFQRQVTPPFVVPLMPLQPQGERRAGPSHLGRRLQPQELPIMNVDRQRNESRAQRGTHGGLQYQRHEDRRQTFSSEVCKEYHFPKKDFPGAKEELQDDNSERKVDEAHGSQRRANVQDRNNEGMVGEWLSKHFLESEELSEGVHEAEDRSAETEGAHGVKGKREDIKGRTRDVEGDRGEPTGSTHKGARRKIYVSGDVSQATGQLHSKLGIRVANKAGQGHSVSESQLPHCSKQNPDVDCAQGPWETGEEQKTEGVLSPTKGKFVLDSTPESEGGSFRGIKRDLNIQEVQVPGQTPQRLKSGRKTRREQQEEDDECAEVLKLSEEFPDNRVMCPFRRLPLKPCDWIGDMRGRRRHVMFQHYDDVVHGNKVTLTPDSARLLIAYDEMFLCFTYTNPVTRRLYCVTLHVCKGYSCSELYQYRCELLSRSRDEKIVDTRLVSPLSKPFYALMTSGRCVRFDEKVLRCFMGDKIIISFTIIRREKFQL